MYYNSFFDTPTNTVTKISENSGLFNEIPSDIRCINRTVEIFAEILFVKYPWFLPLDWKVLLWNWWCLDQGRLYISSFDYFSWASRTCCLRFERSFAAWSSQEPFVITCNQMGLYLGNGINGNSHYNQKGSAPEIKWNVKFTHQESWQDTHGRNIQCTA